MHKVAVIRHVLFEDLGIFYEDLIHQSWQVDYFEAGVFSLSEKLFSPYSLLIILGAPVSVNDVDRYSFLTDEIHLIADWIANKKPILGICLGAQLMARALGATVSPMGFKEIGFGPLLLTEEGKKMALSGFDNDVSVLHWHGETYTLPAGAKCLASSSHCAQQAFSYGNNALALQFHPEVDYCRLEQWLIGHCEELQSSGIDLSKLREDAMLLGPPGQAVAHQFFLRWLDSIK